jgi:hypothetical protein
MDFRTELSKWGYNKGNSIDVEILVNEILPSLFSQQERSYSEEEVKTAFLDGWELRDGDLPFSKAMKKWFEKFKKK